MTMKKSKTRTSIAAVAVVLLTLCLVFATPVSAATEVNNVESFKTAVESGGDVVLTGPIELSEAVTIAQTVTITADTPMTITTSAEDVLTVTGTLILGENITIQASNSILYANGGTVNINGAILTSTHQGNALGFAGNGGVINMNSGSITSYWTGLTASGANSAVNVKGGTIESTNSNAVLSKNSATATITAGTVKSGSNFVTLWTKESGNLVVNGGSIVPTTGSAISVEGATATVSAGSFSGPVKSNDAGTLTVTGGDFTDLSVLNYLGEKAEVTINLAEPVTLSEAVTIAQTVTITADTPMTITTSAEDVLTVTGTLILGENITIQASNSILYANGGTVNINGATLTSTHQGNALGFAGNGGVINMNSGSITSYWTGLTASGANSAVNVKGGTIESTNSNAVLSKNSATATITAGTVKSGSNFVTLWTKESGNLVVNGGSIVPTTGSAISVEGATATVSAGSFSGPVKSNDAGTLTVSGGLFTDEVDAEYIKEGSILAYNTGENFATYPYAVILKSACEVSILANVTQFDIYTDVTDTHTIELTNAGNLPVTVTGLTISPTTEKLTNTTVTPSEIPVRETALFDLSWAELPAGTYTVSVTVQGVGLDDKTDTASIPIIVTERDIPGEDDEDDGSTGGDNTGGNTGNNNQNSGNNSGSSSNSSSSSSSSSSSKPSTPVKPETPAAPEAGEATVETEVTDGGEVKLETPAAGNAPADKPTEPVITGVVLPTGTDSKVTFIPVSEKPAPAGKEKNTKKVFEINVPKYEKGKPAVIKFTMTVAELTADGKTAGEVALWHQDEETGEWTKLVTTYTIVDGIVYFEAITYDFSPFAIVYEDTPAEEPSEEPTEEPATPAPLFAVLAGLGAAVVLRRK